MNQVVEIFIIGLSILIGAIIINSLASFLGLGNWFVFAQSIQDKGFIESLKSQGLLSLTYLMIIYPFLLGTVAFYTKKLLFSN